MEEVPSNKLDHQPRSHSGTGFEVPNSLESSLTDHQQAEGFDIGAFCNESSWNAREFIAFLQRLENVQEPNTMRLPVNVESTNISLQSHRPSNETMDDRDKTAFGYNPENHILEIKTTNVMETAHNQPSLSFQSITTEYESTFDNSLSAPWSPNSGQSWAVASNNSRQRESLSDWVHVDQNPRCMESNQLWESSYPGTDLQSSRFTPDSDIDKTSQPPFVLESLRQTGEEIRSLHSDMLLGVGAQVDQATLSPGRFGAHINESTTVLAFTVLANSLPTYTSTPASSFTPASSCTPDVLRQRQPQRVPSRKKPVKNETQPKKARILREIGNCLRCRAYNLACDEDQTCKQCEHALKSPRIFKDPCYREKLDQITVARHGNGNFGQRNVAFLDYIWVEKTEPGKRIEVRWNLPGGREVNLPWLNITCKKYVSRTTETHHITWNAGDELITVELPPFAADDTAYLTNQVREFLDKATPAVIDYILEDSSDYLVKSTLQEAIRFNTKYHSTTIDLALRIRCSSFCSQGWGSIGGAESLGINTVNFTKSGKCGYAAYDRGWDKPLPLSIDHQFDVALLRIVQEHKKRLLKVLNRMIFPSGKARQQPKRWYEIYLTTFVLLTNLEYVHSGSLSFYHAQMKTSNASSCYSLMEEMIDEYDYSAENLLYHFRSILRGHMGFRMAQENMQELKDREGLDEDAIRYMKTMIEHLPRHRFPQQPVKSTVAPQDLRPPDGRWILQLFDGANART